jgi:hypothetical protein
MSTECRGPPRGSGDPGPVGLPGTERRSIALGAKTFVNNTGYSLSVMLTVRRGDQPGTEAGVDSFSLGQGWSLFVQYSGPENPYLDGIAVNAVDRGNIIASQEFVITRGSDVDNALNTNDTVDFGLQNQSLVLGFRNS